MDRLLSLPKVMHLTSAAFEQGHPIPREFTCQGENVAPPLKIGGLPPEATYLALILDDPDAPRGTFTHWTFWDLPARVTALSRGVDVTDHGASEGRNDFGDIGYGGPCPPSGTHRYYAKVYALREPLGLPRGAPAAEVTRALTTKALAWGELMGTYAKG